MFRLCNLQYFRLDLPFVFVKRLKSIVSISCGAQSSQIIAEYLHQEIVESPSNMICCDAHISAQTKKLK